MLFSIRDLPFFLLFLAAFLVLFRGFFFQGGVFFERDGVFLEIPTRQLTVELLREGDFALWTDAHGNGQPFLANPKNAVVYPSTWLYLLLPLFTAFRLHYLVHAVIGWLGLYGLQKLFRISPPAAFLGASLFSFSGLYLSHFEFYNHIAAFAWMPWILILVFAEYRSGFRRIAALAVLWALQLLAGTPEAVVITLIFAFVQSIFLPGRILKRGAFVLASLALAAMISAVQYLPAFELLSQAERAKTEMTQGPQELIQLLNLPFPGVMGEDRGTGGSDFWAGHLFDKGAPLYYSLYIGFAGLILVLLGLARPMDKDRRGWRAAALVFFLMAAGRYFPPNEIILRLPLLSAIRYPVKYMMGAQFALVLVAAAFFDDLFVRGRIGPEMIRRIWLPLLGFGTGLIIAAPVISRALAPLFVIRDPELLAALQRAFVTGSVVLIATASILGWAGASGKRRAVPAFLFALVALADPLVHNRNINPVVPASFFDPPAILERIDKPETIHRQEVLPDDYRVRLGSGRRAQNFVRQSLFPFSGLGLGVRYVFNRDFFGLYPEDQRSIRKAGPTWDETRLLKYLRNLGCDALIGPVPLKILPAERIEIEGIPVFLQRIGSGQSFPYFVREAVVGRTEAERQDLFFEDDFDPSAAAIVAEAVSGLVESPTPPYFDDSSILHETQGRTACEVNLSAPAIAVFRGNPAPGWSVRLDGEKASVLSVNLGLRGVFVPEGSHVLEWRYLPASFVIGALISGLTLLGLAAAVLWTNPGIRGT